MRAGARRRTDSRIYAGILLGHCVRCEVDRIKRLVRWASNTEQAVFDIAAGICTYFEVVGGVIDRDHIRVSVDMLFEGLRIPGIGTKSSGAVVQNARKS